MAGSGRGYRSRMSDAPETFNEPNADRQPTEAEEAAAERAAADVDLDEVARHYEEAIQTGANVSGEGQIEP